MSLLERVYYFHQQVKKKKYPNSKTLMEEFETSLATSRRDIAYLRDRLLAPLAFSSLKNGFYYTDDDFGLPFENSSKITLLLGMFSKLAEEAGLGQLDEIKQVEQKLASLLTPEYQKVIDAIHCEWVEIEEVQSDIFEIIIDAIVYDRVLDLRYRSATAEESQRFVEPAKLVHYQGRWYLLAFCRLRQEYRFFHIARIVAATFTDEKIEKRKILPEGYLDQSFGIFKGDVQFHAKILFTGRAAELIQYQRWHKNQKIEVSDKGIILTLPVSDHRELSMKILQYGALAEVLEPESLQHYLRQQIEAMQQLYR